MSTKATKIRQDVVFSTLGTEKPGFFVCVSQGKILCKSMLCLLGISRHKSYCFTLAELLQQWQARKVKNDATIYQTVQKAASFKTSAILPSFELVREAQRVFR